MKLSIGKKVNLLSVSIILFLTSLLSCHFIVQQSIALKSELDERATVLLNSLSVNCEYPILAGDRESISRLVSGALSQKDVVFCRIDDVDGTPLAEAGSKKGVAIREFAVPVVTERVIGGEEEGVILGDPTEAREEIATIHLGISLSGLDSKMAGMERAAVLFAALTIVLVSLASSFALKLLLKDPITALVRGTAKIARGELQYRVPVKTDDEIGTLAISFNRMLEELSQTLVSKNYVDNIIRSMTDTLIVTDPEGKIRTVNQAALDLLGYSEDELIGTPVCVLFKDGPIDSEEVARLLSKAGISNTAKTYVSKNGRRIPVLFSSSAMLNDNREIEGIVCVAQDMTERRHAEELLVSQAEELARYNAELERANKELTKLDRAKSDFVSNVSHELRTPLTAIRAYAETLLQYRSLSEEKRYPFTQIILEQTERLSILVEDLLDLSKIEAGEIKLDLRPVDIEKTIDEALQSVRPAADKKGIKIKVISLAEKRHAFADEYRLNQVLVNLLNNAVKFTESGGIISIGEELVCDRGGKAADHGSTGARASMGTDVGMGTGVNIEARANMVAEAALPGFLCITVSDDGIGIPPDELERIFDKFKQVAEKTRGKPAGTGLGLPICRQLVEKMGGNIWVESKLGEGSAFHFTVPLAQEIDQESGSSLVPNSEPAEFVCESNLE